MKPSSFSRKYAVTLCPPWSFVIITLFSRTDFGVGGRKEGRKEGRKAAIFHALASFGDGGGDVLVGRVAVVVVGARWMRCRYTPHKEMTDDSILSL